MLSAVKSRFQGCRPEAAFHKLAKPMPPQALVPASWRVIGTGRVYVENTHTRLQASLAVGPQASAHSVRARAWSATDLPWHSSGRSAWAGGQSPCASPLCPWQTQVPRAWSEAGWLQPPIPPKQGGGSSAGCISPRGTGGGAITRHRPSQGEASAPRADRPPPRPRSGHSAESPVDISNGAFFHLRNGGSAPACLGGSSQVPRGHRPRARES